MCERERKTERGKEGERERERERGTEEGGEREREKEREFHLFTHSLVSSCMCPDGTSNLQP